MSSEIDFQERFEQYDKALHYCEYCGQIFPSTGVFFAHRKASDVAAVDRLTDTGFDGYTVVQPGERVGEARVGTEPCTAEYRDEFRQPDRSEPADFGGGETTGVQDL